MHSLMKSLTEWFFYLGQKINDDQITNESIDIRSIFLKLAFW
jgi:hypothetical protein